MNIENKDNIAPADQLGEVQNKLADVLLVGVDDNGEDKFTLVVGRKNVVEKTTEVLNIIQGNKARQLYNELITIIKPEAK